MLQATSGKLTDSANSKAVKDDRRLPAQDPVRGRTPSARCPRTEPDQLSKDETIGYISVTLTLSSSDLDEDEANEIIDATDPAARRRPQGRASAATSGQEVSKPEHPLQRGDRHRSRR